MEKSKIIQHTTTQKTTAPKRTSKRPSQSIDKQKSKDSETAKGFQFESFTDVFSLSERPFSDNYVEQVAKDLAQWASKDPEALNLKQFLMIRGICKDTYYRFLKRSPFMEQAHKFALDCFAAKRDVGAVTKKYDSGYVEKTMPLYDAEYKSWVLEKAAAKDEADAERGIRTIYVKKFPSVDSVPKAE